VLIYVFYVLIVKNIWIKEIDKINDIIPLSVVFHMQERTEKHHEMNQTHQW